MTDSFLLSIESAASELAGRRAQINTAWEALRVSVRAMHPDYDLLDTGKVVHATEVSRTDIDRRTVDYKVTLKYEGGDVEPVAPSPLDDAPLYDRPPVDTARSPGIAPRGTDESSEDYYARLKRRILWYVEGWSEEDFLREGRDAVLERLLESRPANTTPDDVTAALDSLRISWPTRESEAPVETVPLVTDEEASLGFTEPPTADALDMRRRARAQGIDPTQPGLTLEMVQAAERRTRAREAQPAAEAATEPPTPDEAPAEKEVEKRPLENRGTRSDGRANNVPHWSQRSQVVESEQFMHTVYDALVGKKMLPQEIIKTMGLDDTSATKNRVGDALRTLESRKAVERTGERRRPDWMSSGRYSDEWAVARQWKDRDGNIWEKSPANPEAISTPPQ